MKIELIFVIFALIGALDKLFGNRLKLGEAFEKGIMTAGPLIISISGMMVLTPVIAKELSEILEPLLNVLSIDSSSIAVLFPVDAGGAQIAYEISDNTQLRAYNGIVVASMFGATLCPVIPLALQMVSSKYYEDVLTGFLCGFITIPFGCIIAGLLMGCSLGDLFRHTLPIIIMSCIIGIGIWKNPRITQCVFNIFSKFLSAFILVGLCIGIIHQVLGVTLIPGIAPISESFLIIGNIVILLAGVFPFIEVLKRVLKNPLKKCAERMHVDEFTVVGLMTTLANSIPVFSMLEKMDKRGRIMNIAFSVSAGYVIGDHLAFVLAFDRKYALPMVVGKIISAILALILSNIIFRKIINKK